MQYPDALKLQKKWEEAGNKPCSHPHLEKEYYLSMQGFDRICTTCGYEMSPAEYKERAGK